MSGVASSVGPNPAYLSALLAEEYTAVRSVDPADLLPRDLDLLTGGDWGVSLEWSDGSKRSGEWREGGWHMISTSYAPVEVNLSEAFAALDLEHDVTSADLGKNPNIENHCHWHLLPDAVLDRIVGNMDLTDVARFMRTCRRFFNHMRDCHPFWFKVANLLKPLAHDATFLIPDDLNKPGFELYQICSSVLKELFPSPTMEFFLHHSFTQRVIQPLVHVRAFKVFPEADRVGVLCSDSNWWQSRLWLRILPLSRVGNGEQTVSIKLEDRWVVRNYFVQRNTAVLWLSETGSWDEGLFPVLISFPLDHKTGEVWKPIIHADFRTMIRHVAVSASYIVAVVEQKVDDPVEAHDNQLYVWPLRGDGLTYATQPFIRPLHHFVSCLALCGTQLGLIRLPKFRCHKGSALCRKRDCKPYTLYDGYHQHEYQPVVLQMEDLGSPVDFTGLSLTPVHHSALHEDCEKLYQRRYQLGPALEIIDPRSPYFRSHLPESNYSHLEGASGVLSSSGDGHVRVGPFVVSPTSLGQFYHLERHGVVRTSLGPRQRYSILNVRYNERSVVDTLVVESYKGAHYFSGANLLYTDGGILYLRRLPRV